MANVVEMPKLGFDMAEGTLASWVKKEGELIEKGEALAEIETDKATIQVESSFSGTILKELIEVNTTVPVGTPIAVIGEQGEEYDLNALGEIKSAESGKEKKSVNPEPDVTVAKEETTEKPQDRLKVSPLAKALSVENSVDLSSITGSGPGGRIVKRDIEKYLTSVEAQPAETTSPTVKIQAGEETLQPLSKLRKTIGARMQQSKQTIPHFYVTYSYDVEILLKMRAEINQGRRKEEHISINDFLVKAVAITLRQFPKLNASLDGTALTLHGDIHIGNAVAVEEGLLTVVCRSADQKSLLQISDEMRAMINRVKNGKVNPQDIEGSTFTISNLGMYGVEEFSAIINPPETAILAVSSAMQVPVVADGVVKPGMRMKATLSADHRASDGAEAALFMKELATYLEQPWRMW